MASAFSPFFFIAESMTTVTSTEMRVDRKSLRVSVHHLHSRTIRKLPNSLLFPSHQLRNEIFSKKQCDCQKKLPSEANWRGYNDIKTWNKNKKALKRIDMQWPVYWSWFLFFFFFLPFVISYLFLISHKSSTFNRPTTVSGMQINGSVVRKTFAPRDEINVVIEYNHVSFWNWIFFFSWSFLRPSFRLMNKDTIWRLFTPRS